MNYIAHIQLAHESQTSLLGNFLGDFVKGSDLSSYSSDLAQGISLHRAIDSFTDQHPVQTPLRELFPPESRRYAGIALDVYFDHLLVNNWQHFGSGSLDSMLHNFYQELNDYQGQPSERFMAVRESLIAKRWLSIYKDASSCLQVMHNIEKRLRRPVSFAKSTYAVLCKHHGRISESFFLLYPHLQEYAKQYPDEQQKKRAQHDS